MIAKIDISDEISPMLKRLVDSNPRYLSALGKSVGWWYQKEIKTEVKEGHAGNVEYPERWSLELRRKLDPRAPKTWYGRMRSAIGYEYTNGVVNIGWTSNTASRYGDLQEQGFKKAVTQKMRNYFRSVGINLSNNIQQLNIPERPIYEPIASVMTPKVAPYVTEKLNHYMQGNVEFGKKNRRRYKVY